FAMQKDHNVSILLDRSTFAQITHLRLLVAALLRTTVQLRDRDDRNLEFLREELERTRELGDLLLTRLDALAGAHELEIVDDDQLEVVALLEAAALRPDLHERHVRRVVDEQRRLG